MKKTIAFFSLICLANGLHAMEIDEAQEDYTTQLYYEINAQKESNFNELRKVLCDQPTVDLHEDIWSDLQQYADQLTKPIVSQASWHYRWNNTINCFAKIRATDLENIETFFIEREDREQIFFSESAFTHRNITHTGLVPFNAEKVKTILKRYPYIIQFISNAEFAKKMQSRRIEDVAQKEQEKAAKQQHLEQLRKSVYGNKK